MKLEDFNNIDFKNIANLPWPVKAVLLGVFFVIVLAGGYFVLWSPALEELDLAKQKESELKTQYMDKKRQAFNLDAYKQQMVDVEKTFGALLKQLPEKSQMDGLLTDINQAGLSRGLEFELFKPNPEVISEVYAETPITIKVIGSYQNIGQFAAEISRLSRIVTLNNVHITTIDAEAKDSNVNKKDTRAAKDDRLVMEALAKTYRYLDANEVADKKKNAKLEPGQAK